MPIVQKNGTAHGMSPALIAALPFIGALFPGLMIRVGRNACAVMAGFFSLMALIISTGFVVDNTIVVLVVVAVSAVTMIALDAAFGGIMGLIIGA